MKVKWQNLRVAPVARLVRSESLDRQASHRRAEFSVSGMVCSL